jgi:hypothetical protein
MGMDMDTYTDMDMDMDVDAIWTWTLTLTWHGPTWTWTSVFNITQSSQLGANCIIVSPQNSPTAPAQYCRVLYSTVPTEYSGLTLNTDTLSITQQNWIFCATSASSCSFMVQCHNVQSAYGMAKILGIGHMATGFQDYNNSSRQSRFNCCEDAETGVMLLLWWCPFIFKK